MTAEEAESITVPAHVIFQSWGQLAGSILDDNTSDPRAVIGSDEASKELTTYAVITTAPVTLTQAQRCQRTTVRAATRGRTWRHATVPANLHYTFQAEMEVTSDLLLHVPKEEPNPGLFQQALLGGVLNGTPVEDVGNAVAIGDPAS